MSVRQSVRRLVSVGFILLFSGAVALFAQERAQENEVERLRGEVEDLQSDVQSLAKAVDDILWFNRLGDVAEIDKITYVGPPNPKGREIYGIKNERHPLRVYAYVFVPRKLDKSRRHPLLVLPHGGVHANFTTYHTHIIREMMDQGYVVLAPEYRGSTGYGREFYQAIDYGGLEVEDVVAGRDWAVENLSFVDDKRVGMIGWSHGGLISLMAVFNHPDKFQVAYAGVPVSDLLARMGYTTQDYRDEFSATYHIGKTANQDVEEYRRRSPLWNVAKLKTPLLVHTTTNDRDVNVVEVESLIQALKAAGKDFQYKIYQDAPGGHSFNRIDTPLARQSRREIYEFLAQYLKP
ncbi:MAG: alpha/beta hydrolase family protein [Acidobacteriota bacterium]